jgi:hypothetical protein
MRSGRADLDLRGVRIESPAGVEALAEHGKDVGVI